VAVDQGRHRSPSPRADGSCPSRRR
jgi:hypothetical protein